MRAMVARLLAAHEVLQAPDRASAEALIAHGGYDLLLTDVRLPDGSGADLLAQSRARHPSAEVILMTAFASVEAAVEAVRAGAYDYVAKPFEPDDLLLKVERALDRHALRARAEAAEAALRRQAGFGDMLGESAGMKQVRFLIERVCDLDVTVLLNGESGTGKEVAARAIHQASVRRDLAFVAVNCGAIPDHLLESELFGHVKGAFTGADQARSGLVEEAGAGTLFLDEIGDLPLDLQVKLNRALQERVYRRVGESRERPLQARVIAATHKDLTGEVEAGRFREDLFFRLNVYPIALPPLRERGDDLFLLARHFVAAATERFERPPTSLTPAALRALANYHWPGNVRELAHALERAVILSAEPPLDVTDLPQAIAETPPVAARADALPGLAEMPYREALDWARERALRQYLHALLQRHAGNVTHAARQAGVERESLHRLIRKARLDAADYRG